MSPRLVAVPTCSQCGSTSALDPCRACVTPEQARALKYPAVADEPWLDLNRRLWATSGHRPPRVGSEDARVIHEMCRAGEVPKEAPK